MAIISGSDAGKTGSVAKNARQRVASATGSVPGVAARISVYGVRKRHNSAARWKMASGEVSQANAAAYQASAAR